MAVIARDREDNTSSVVDDLLPWLWGIKKSLDGLSSADGHGTDLDELVSNCIRTFKNDARYRNDVRFLKIWFLYMDASPEFESIFREMDQNKICTSNSLLYEWYALFLEAKGKLSDAFLVYQLGISRNAEPLERLKKAQAFFRDRMSEIVKVCSNDKMGDGDSFDLSVSYINPWSISTVKDLLQKMHSQISKYEGYHPSNKAYSGKVPLSSLQKSARNKVIEIGVKKYQIKGCAGQGGFAQVFKAYVNSNPDDVVALKIQKPAFPWEFYMYRQLDKRIPESHRPSFGFAHRLHLYSDYSILVCDYLSNGTLQDAINSNVVIGGFMEEVLCIYYTIEMLSMLETLHSAGIIHGDFKPDNLLIRYARDDLTEHCFRDRTGPWIDQGLCLVDWGRGIDASLFPDEIKFNGDCRTSGFRCVEMQEKKPWTFQVDTYGLCVIVHMMLHNSYMEIEKRASSDDGYVYQPKSHFKRYWQVKLWKDLFTKLLNTNPNDDHKMLLKNLKEAFQDYMCSNPQLIKKLKQLLVKQRTSLCSS
ncbi:mitotic checkpoint serine/threonine-protein kinase BUB1 isoform X1 [Actinidia eriantha]|uniref:mitotic checkpoint serine/threonine-protein kinase BUB1 isoform X1 n=2 Tax=Actinidia eriantha TaxID=165200 RepID=UPI00258F8E4F|nr:mitotic checkpoint serine/threonine-protein kinase BUB1 isoform X1 [Actinidia eriantha]